MEKEIRNFEIEYKFDKESGIIEGRAIPFNVFSPNREGFREMISPEAVEGVIERSDIFLLYNHDKSQGFLARNNKGKGSLKIDVRDDGVYFSFKVKNDNLSNYVYERLLDGELTETSWAFSVNKDGQTWRIAEDGVDERIITKFSGLYDFSVVDNSYYGIADTVGCRMYAEIKEERRLAEEAAQKAEEEKRQAEEEAQRQEQERLEQEKREQEEKEAQEKEEKLKTYYQGIREQYLK